MSEDSKRMQEFIETAKTITENLNAVCDYNMRKQMNIPILKNKKFLLSLLGPVFALVMLYFSSHIHDFFYEDVLYFTFMVGIGVSFVMDVLRIIFTP